MENLNFTTLNDKTKCIIDYILLMAKYESMLWTSIIGWIKGISVECQTYF